MLLESRYDLRPSVCFFRAEGRDCVIVDIRRDCRAYKHAKYVMALEAVENLERFGDGAGSYWADLGYTWYAGI